MKKITSEQWSPEVLEKLIPGHSVDCVILGYRNGNLYVLLLEWKGTGIWGLPGGFIYRDEDMDCAAGRVLKERTGLDYPFLSQFHTFGDYGRRDPAQTPQLLETWDAEDTRLRDWIIQRFITTGYFALVNIDACGPLKPDPLSSQCSWIPSRTLPLLAFDHKEIIHTAMEHLRRQVNYLPVGESLLPETFTMKDLQLLHEAILGKKLDRANFQRKMLKSELLIRGARKTGTGPHKAPYLYRFLPEKQ